jgi:hypothetical protein
MNLVHYHLEEKKTVGPYPKTQGYSNTNSSSNSNNNNNNNNNSKCVLNFKI